MERKKIPERGLGGGQSLEQGLLSARRDGPCSGHLALVLIAAESWAWSLSGAPALPHGDSGSCRDVLCLQTQTTHGAPGRVDLQVSDTNTCSGAQGRDFHRGMQVYLKEPQSWL